MTKSPDLSRRLASAATASLSERHLEWGAAMLAEQETLTGVERWRWTLGVLQASLALKGRALLYPLAFAAAVASMIFYQWSADESLVTVGVLGVLALALGLIEPRRVLLSGCVVGAVVASVNAFERITGVRPDYETHVHHLLGCLRWLVLIIPALLCAALGGVVRRRLNSAERLP